MKLLTLLLIACMIFPGAADRLSDSMIGFLPAVRAFLPCLIILVAIYLLLKNVWKS